MGITLSFGSLFLVAISSPNQIFLKPPDHLFNQSPSSVSGKSAQKAKQDNLNVYTQIYTTCVADLIGFFIYVHSPPDHLYRSLRNISCECVSRCVQINVSEINRFNEFFIQPTTQRPSAATTAVQHEICRHTSINSSSTNDSRLMF